MTAVEGKAAITFDLHSMHDQEANSYTAKIGLESRPVHEDHVDVIYS